MHGDLLPEFYLVLWLSLFNKLCHCTKYGKCRWVCALWRSGTERRATGKSAGKACNLCTLIDFTAWSCGHILSTLRNSHNAQTMPAPKTKAKSLCTHTTPLVGACVWISCSTNGKKNPISGPRSPNASSAISHFSSPPPSPALFSSAAKKRLDEITYKMHMRRDWTYRKNSIESLYHLTDCKSAPVIAYPHASSAWFRKSTTSGTIISCRCIPLTRQQPVTEDTKHKKKLIAHYSSDFHAHRKCARASKRQ